MIRLPLSSSPPAKPSGGSITRERAAMLLIASSASLTARRLFLVGSRRANLSNLMGSCNARRLEASFQ